MRLGVRQQRLGGGGVWGMCRARGTLGCARVRSGALGCSRVLSGGVPGMADGTVRLSTVTVSVAISSAVARGPSRPFLTCGGRGAPTQLRGGSLQGEGRASMSGLRTAPS